MVAAVVGIQQLYTVNKDRAAATAISRVLQRVRSSWRSSLPNSGRYAGR